MTRPVSEVTVRRQTGIERKKQAKAARKRRRLRGARRPRRLTAKQKALVRKRKASGFFRKAAALRSSLDLPATIVGSISHRMEYIDLILEVASGFQDEKQSAREFAKLFIEKDPAFSNTDTGMAAILFEAYLFEKAEDVVEQFLETQLEGQDTTFLALFEGQLKDESVKKLANGVKEFCTFESLVKAGDTNHEDGTVSDVTILECTPKRGVASKARQQQKAKKPEPTMRTEGLLPETKADYEAVIEEGGITDNAFMYLYPNLWETAHEGQHNGDILRAEDNRGATWYCHEGVWLPDASALDEAFKKGQKVTAKEDQTRTNIVSKKPLKVKKGDRGVVDRLDGDDVIVRWGKQGLVRYKRFGEMPIESDETATPPVAEQVVVKAKHPGRTGLPDGAFKEWKVPKLVVHFRKLGKKIGQGPMMKTLLNLERWNKKDDPALSKKARAIIDQVKESIEEATLDAEIKRSKLPAAKVKALLKDWMRKKGLGDLTDIKSANIAVSGQQVQVNIETFKQGRAQFNTRKAKVMEDLSEGFEALFQTPTRANRFAREIRIHARTIRPNGTKVYYEAKDAEHTEEETHADAIDELCRKHGGKKKKKKHVKEEEDITSIVAGPFLGDGEPRMIHNGHCEVTGFPTALQAGPLYLESEEGFQSKFLAWTVRKEGTDDGKVLVHVGSQMYRLPATLSEVKGLLDKMEEFYEDLPHEFDSMIEAFLQEYCEEKGTRLCHEDVVSTGLEEALEEWTSHEFIPQRDARIQSNCRMRRLAMGEDLDTVSRLHEAKGAVPRYQGTRKMELTNFGTTLAGKYGATGTLKDKKTWEELQTYLRNTRKHKDISSVRIKFLDGKKETVNIGLKEDLDGRPPSEAEEHAVLDEDRNVLFRGNLPECKAWVQETGTTGVTYYRSVDTDLDEALEEIGAINLDEAITKAWGQHVKDIGDKHRAEFKRLLKANKGGRYIGYALDHRGVVHIIGTKEVVGVSPVPPRGDELTVDFVRMIHEDDLEGSALVVEGDLTDATTSAMVGGFKGAILGKVGEKATTRTVECPGCEGKVLAATGYCVRCKKKTVMKEDLDEYELAPTDLKHYTLVVRADDDETRQVRKALRNKKGFRLNVLSRRETAVTIDVDLDDQPSDAKKKLDKVLKQAGIKAESVEEAKKQDPTGDNISNYIRNTLSGTDRKTTPDLLFGVARRAFKNLTKPQFMAAWKTLVKEGYLKKVGKSYMWESIEEGQSGLTLEKIRMGGEYQSFKVLKGKSLVGFLIQTGKNTADEEHPWKAFRAARGKVGEKIGFYYKRDGGKRAALQAIANQALESIQIACGDCGCEWKAPLLEDQTVPSCPQCGSPGTLRDASIDEAEASEFAVIVSNSDAPVGDVKAKVLAAFKGVGKVLKSGTVKYEGPRDFVLILRSARNFKTLDNRLDKALAGGLGDDYERYEITRVADRVATIKKLLGVREDLDEATARLTPEGKSVLNKVRAWAKKNGWRALTANVRAALGRNAFVWAKYGADFKSEAQGAVKLGTTTVPVVYKKGKDDQHLIVLKATNKVIRFESIDEQLTTAMATWKKGGKKWSLKFNKSKDVTSTDRKKAKAAIRDYHMKFVESIEEAVVTLEFGRQLSKQKAQDVSAIIHSQAKTGLRREADGTHYAIVQQKHMKYLLPALSKRGFKKGRDFTVEESIDEQLTTVVSGIKVKEPTHMKALARKAGKSGKQALELWGKAQVAANKQYPELKAAKGKGGEKERRYYKVVTAIFKNMLGLGKEECEQADPIIAEVLCHSCRSTTDLFLYPHNVGACAECGSIHVTPTGEMHYATEEEIEVADPNLKEAVTIGTPPDLMLKWHVMQANVYTDGKKEANKVLREVRKHFGDYDPKKGMFGGVIKGAKAGTSGVGLHVVVNPNVSTERFTGGLKDALAKTGLQLKGSAFEVKDIGIVADLNEEA